MKQRTVILETVVGQNDTAVQVGDVLRSVSGVPNSRLDQYMAFPSTGNVLLTR